MGSGRRARAISFILSILLALQCVLPMATYAVEHEVQLENPGATSDQAQRVRQIVIDGVDVPKAGIVLDQTATVTTADGPTWDIPVVWVRDDLQVENDVAAEGRTYIPVLAFLVPQEYSLDGDVVTVTLSDPLTKLFGTNNIVSVYNTERGITYILPVSLVDLFAGGTSAESSQADSIEQLTNTTSQGPANDILVPTGAASIDNTPTSDDAPANDASATRSRVDIYCATSARNAFTDEDLEWMIGLIIDRLEPQAVELLLSSFPSFREAANNGQIGTQIGLYIYYNEGDVDGKSEHGTSSDALAYVTGRAKMIDGELKYCYMLAVNLDDLTPKDEDEKPLRDSSAGKYKLMRSGESLQTLENTITHELFHAIMDDYNRTGMMGATNLSEAFTIVNSSTPTDEALQRYQSLAFPLWFVEGSASAVENVYQFRYDRFQQLRRLQGDNLMFGTGDLDDRFTSKLILDNYLYAMDKDGQKAYFDLECSGNMRDGDGNELNNVPARYVSGYLATLYLSELAVRHVNSNDTSIATTADGVTTVDAGKLRWGLDVILRWMHNGDTMDEVICNVSPLTADGKPLYSNTEEFTKRFIKGMNDPAKPNIDFDLLDRIMEGGVDPSTLDMPSLNDEMQRADIESLSFVQAYLNYLLDVENGLPTGVRPNGSILFDLNKNYVTPLDSTKETSSDSLKIVESNEMVESSVRSDEAQIGGGKSDPDQGTDHQLAATVEGAQENAVRAQAGVQVGPQPGALTNVSNAQPEVAQVQAVAQGETAFVQDGSQPGVQANAANSQPQAAVAPSEEMAEANVGAQSEAQDDVVTNGAEVPNVQESNGLPTAA